MKAVIDFLFGKSPDIFDKDGTVRHKHPEKKWDDWNSRYQQGPEYNWRNHVGTRGIDSRAQKKPQ